MRRITRQIMLMRVVSNTSPLLNLSIIGRLDLVQTQFGRVLIPPAVLNELQIHSARPGSDTLKQAIDAGWIVLHDTPDEVQVAKLQRDLDRGEAEALALAMEVKASLVLLDEREARGRARQLELSVTGAIGVLLEGYRTGDLSSFEAALDGLQEKAGFWISSTLRGRALRASEELRRST